MKFRNQYITDEFISFESEKFCHAEISLLNLKIVLNLKFRFSHSQNWNKSLHLFLVDSKYSNLNEKS